MLDLLRKHIEEIVHLDDSEFEFVSPFFKVKRYRKRQFVIQENQAVTHVFFVIKGLLKSSLMDNNGKEYIVQLACENWWISDFAAFYKREESCLAVECLEDSELLYISYDDLNTLAFKLPKMEHFFRVKSNLGYVAIQQRLLSMMNKTVKERYEDFIHQYPTILQRVPKQLIASYLGVSRETLSRFT